MKNIDSLLNQGSAAMAVPLDVEKTAKLNHFLALFNKWNRAYNLSAIRAPDQIISKHILDSLSIVRYLQGETFIDVGTGGGLPGIPLAIVLPQCHFTLLDSNGKKTRFLFQVVQSLNLSNVKVVNERVENFKPDDLFDGVISRAFASLQLMTDCCQHLLKDDGNFWAMKGVFPQDELSEVKKHYMVEACSKLEVPGVDAERCLVVIKKRQLP